MTEYEVRVDVALVMRVMAEDENEAKKLAFCNPLWVQEPTGENRKRIKGVCWGPEEIQVVEVLQPK